MIYLALDGNNKSNHLINHCNPGDFSIWDGKGYFPPAKEYADYLRAFGHLVDEEVSSFSQLSTRNSSAQLDS